MAVTMFRFKQLVQGAGERFRRVAQDSDGFILLESIMAITIFAALGTALMVGIRTANISGEVVDKQIGAVPKTVLEQKLKSHL